MNYFKKGVRVEIGNGHSTLFWSHKWVMDGPLSSEALTSIPGDVVNATVEEMWDTQHNWKWDKFANLLPKNILKIIMPHRLFPGEDNEDRLIWSGSSSGKMTIKSVLTAIREDTWEDADHIWKLIWRLQASQHVCFFTSLIAQDHNVPSPISREGNEDHLI